MRTPTHVLGAVGGVAGEVGIGVLAAVHVGDESAVALLQGGIWGFGIFDNGDAAKVEAAKAFVKFMTEDEAQYKKIVEATGYWATRDVSGLSGFVQLPEGSARLSRLGGRVGLGHKGVQLGLHVAAVADALTCSRIKPS